MDIQKIELWEMFVPCTSNDGVPFRTRFHKVFDRKVYTMVGGITILHPVKGKWLNNTNTLFDERNIPVRIACTKEQIEKILEFAIKYYEQEAMMAYKISEEVIIKHKL